MLIAAQSRCTKFFVNGDSYTVFSLWVAIFHFKSSNSFKSCFEVMRDPLFLYWEQINEIIIFVNQYKHMQDEHVRGKKYHRFKWQMQFRL